MFFLFFLCISFLLLKNQIGHFRINFDKMKSKPNFIYAFTKHIHLHIYGCICMCMLCYEYIAFINW